MATISQKAYETSVNAMTTELNSLASAGRAISSALGGDASAAALMADFQLKVTFGTGPTAETTCDLYLLRSVDGTNYADGGSSVRPDPNAYVGSFAVRSVNTIQYIDIPDVPMPPGLFKALLVNNTNQAFPASGSTLVMRPHNRTVA